MSQISQTGIIGNQRTRRFKTYVTLSQMGIGGVNIRRITGDKREGFTGHRCEPAALQETCVGDGELLRIMLRQADRCGLQINTCYLAVRTLAGNRQSNRTGAGT